MNYGVPELGLLVHLNAGLWLEMQYGVDLGVYRPHLAATCTSVGTDLSFNGTQSKVKMRLVFSFLLSLVCLIQNTVALGQNATITFSSTKEATLQLAGNGQSPQILLDRSDWPGVLRAAGDLATDFGRVTGVNGSTAYVSGLNGTYHNSTAGTIIAGSIGNSTIIKSLVKSGKIDVSDIEGKWEAFVSKVVDSPAPGIKSALVIAGMIHKMNDICPY